MNELFELFGRFSDSVLEAVKSLQAKYEDPCAPVIRNSLLRIVSSRAYLNTPFEIRVNEIHGILKKTIPTMFQKISQEMKMT